MKIKAKWGFIGNADKLNSDSATVRVGDTFGNVDKEYANVLIGKGLAEEWDGKAKPTSDKQAKPAQAGKAAAGADKQTKAAEAK